MYDIWDSLDVDIKTDSGKIVLVTEIVQNPLNIDINWLIDEL